MSSGRIPSVVSSNFFYFMTNSARRAKRFMNGHIFVSGEPVYAGEKTTRGNCYLCGKKVPKEQLAIRTVLDTGSWAGGPHIELEMPVCEKCREVIDIPDWKCLKKGWAENLLPLLFVFIGGLIDACFFMGIAALTVGLVSAAFGNSAFLTMYLNPKNTIGIYSSVFIAVPLLLRILKLW